MFTPDMSSGSRSFLSSYPAYATLKVWWKSDSPFESYSSLEDTKFVDVKLAAIRYFIHQSSTFLLNSRSSLNTMSAAELNDGELNNYRLISVGSKRPVDEQLSLRQAGVTSGDEYVLVSKRKAPKTETKKETNNETITLATIEDKTQVLPENPRALQRNYRANHRQEFRNDLSRIICTLVETSQKLLWCHPDAENIFRQAEEFLSQSSIDESDNSRTTMSNKNNQSVDRNVIKKQLLDMGFTSEQAVRALKRTKYDFQSAMELLLINPDIEEPTDVEESTSTIEGKKTKRYPLYNRNGPFISVRKFRQDQFQPNPQAIRALKEMGFDDDSIFEALRISNNDKNSACDFLLSDTEAQNRLRSGNEEQLFDVNSSIYRALMENPIIQRVLNSPKTFFILLQVSENPTLISNYMSDPDVGNMLVQISRIYQSDQENTMDARQAPEPPIRRSLLVTNHFATRNSTDDDDDDDSD